LLAKGRGLQDAEAFPLMRSVFLSRLASTVVLWTAVLWTIFAGNELGFFALLAVLGLGALWEFYQMLKLNVAAGTFQGQARFKWTGMFCGAALLAGVFWAYGFNRTAFSWMGCRKAMELMPPAEVEIFLLLAVVLAVFCRQLFHRYGSGTDSVTTVASRSLAAMACTLFGLFYIIWLFGFLLKIVYVVPRADEAMAALSPLLAPGKVVGQFYVLYLVVVTDRKSVV
jgi:phosphatidate cytidylyltransferase